MNSLRFFILLLTLICVGSAEAADSGPRAHARGSFDPATGVYTVVSGDDLGPIAARFGMSLAQIGQQNELSSDQIQVGQKLVVAPPSLGSPVSQTPAPEAAPKSESPAPDLPPDPWPRKVQAKGHTLLVYQPQVESWKDNQLALRIAIAVESKGSEDNAFGVINATARTQVDREQRMVMLEDLAITKADFPTLPALADSLVAADVDQLFSSQVRTIPLDRLETALGVAKTDPGGQVAVQNPVPRDIVSERPAVLVPIQGSPVLKPAQDADAGAQRVINTRAVILTSGENEPYYPHLLDGWVTAPTLAGPWGRADVTPAGIDAIRQPPRRAWRGGPVERQPEHADPGSARSRYPGCLCKRDADRADRLSGAAGSGAD